jgi:hypothetical protein
MRVDSSNWVVMRGLFRAAKGTVPPGEFVRELGLSEQSMQMPSWLTEWSQSCDDMSLHLRDEEAPRARQAQAVE